jgi:hypothetical protein
VLIEAGRPARFAPDSLGPDDDDVGHLVNWLTVMQARKDPNATVDHGFSHAIVCIMAAQSYWSGKKLYWNQKMRKLPMSVSDRYLSIISLRGQ